MYIVQIEQDVPDYDRWKEVFDSDPLGRKQAGVQRHTVARAEDNDRHLIIDLELATADQARAMVEALYKLWGRVEGDVIEKGATARVYEVAEVVDPE